MTALVWKSATRCESGLCVEVALTDHAQVRDSDEPDGPRLRFSRSAWQEFVAALKAGEFDRREQ